MENRKENELLERKRRAHYEETDNNDRLVINFRNINHTMRFLYEGKGSQKRILMTLLEEGSITQRSLTRQLGIQPGSASEVIAKLEKNGLIARMESAEDRRTTDITLTEQGRRLAKEAKEQRKKRHEEMFSCLAEEERGMLLGLLEKINADWKERYQSIGEKCRRMHEDHGRRKSRGNHERHHHETVEGD